MDGGPARYDRRPSMRSNIVPTILMRSSKRYRRESHRRKSGPGMIVDILKRFLVAAARSILIVDQPMDIEADGVMRPL